MSDALTVVRDSNSDRLALARRLLFAARVTGGALVDLDDAADAIAQAFEHGRRFGLARRLGAQACRVCGCTWLDPCRPDPCAWVATDLCTACAPFVKGA